MRAVSRAVTAVDPFEAQPADLVEAQPADLVEAQPADLAGSTKEYLYEY